MNDPRDYVPGSSPPTLLGRGLYFADLDFCNAGPDDGGGLWMTMAGFPELAFQIVEEHGPAGGWPRVRIIGSREEVARFVTEQQFYDPRYEDTDPLSAWVQHLDTNGGWIG